MGPNETTRIDERDALVYWLEVGSKMINDLACDEGDLFPMNERQKCGTVRDFQSVDVDVATTTKTPRMSSRALLPSEPNGPYAYGALRSYWPSLRTTSVATNDSGWLPNHRLLFSPNERSRRASSPAVLSREG